MNRQTPPTTAPSTTAERYAALRELGDAYLDAMHAVPGWAERFNAALAKVNETRQQVDA